MKNKLTILTAATFGAALVLIAIARECGLSAAYMPHGGIDAHRDTPVTHRVPVMGTAEQIEKFIKEVNP